MTTNFETDRLILRPLRLSDAASIFEYAQDPEMTRFTSWDHHKSIEEAKAFIKEAIERYKTTPLDPLAIILKSDPERVIGTVGIKARSHPYEAELAYGLARTYWRQGLMREACNSLIDIAFKEHGFKRIYATCARENIASKAVMKKIGMQFEGCMRARSFRKDRFWDVEMYSILVSDWKSHPLKDLEIIYEPEPAAEKIDILVQGLAQYAAEKKGMPPIERFGFFAVDKNKMVQAGCYGVIYYGCLYTDLLWVAPHLRGKGYGKRLLKAAEDLGKRKGCSMATINTMDWEALDLYKKLGYTLELTRLGYINDSTLYFLRKPLA